MKPMKHYTALLATVQLSAGLLGDSELQIKCGLTGGDYFDDTTRSAADTEGDTNLLLVLKSRSTPALSLLPTQY